MKIDFELLKEQKQALVLFLDDNKLTKKRIEYFTGIIHLLDEIQDIKEIQFSQKWLKNEINEIKFNIERRAEEFDFNKNDYVELYSCDIDHDDFCKFPQEELEHHNFELGMYRAYLNTLNKVKKIPNVKDIIKKNNKTNLVVLNFYTGEVDIYNDIDTVEDWEEHLTEVLEYKLSNIQWMIVDELIINEH